MTIEPLDRTDEEDAGSPTRVLPLSTGPRTELPLAGPPAWERKLVRLVVCTDLLAGLLAGLLALGLRFGSSVDGHYAVVTVGLPVALVVANALGRCYEPRFLATGSEEYRRVFEAGTRLLMLIALTDLAFKLDIARLYVLLFFPVAILGCLVGRYTVRQVLAARRRTGRSLHHVLVVGRERSCAELVRQLRREPEAGFHVVGACINVAREPYVEGVPVVGRSSDGILEALHKTGADTVAVGAWSDLTQEDLRTLSWQLEGTGVDLVVAPSFADIAGPRIHIRPVAGLPLLHIEEPEFRGGRRLLKGLVDRVVSLTALLLLGPLLALLAVLVRLDSRGPAMFRQTRVGVGGRDFTMYKFRSMYVDAEERISDLLDANESDGLLFKMRDDPRVTRLGRLLRRYSLDELPQLCNVLLGSMSLVGPRPPLPREVEQYEDAVRRRLLVKPGITGLWQVSGRSELSWAESVRLDLHYVENWSLAWDVMILWRTLSAVVRRHGAY